MYKSLNNSSPKVFQNKFKSVNHKYPTHHSKQNLVIPRFNLKQQGSQFLIEVLIYGIDVSTQRQK